MKTTQVEGPGGIQFELPVRYLDWSAIMADFPVPVEAARRLLPTEKLQPALYKPGTAIISLLAMEYRQVVSMTPYNEFGIMVPVLYEPGANIPALPLLFPSWFKRFGLYVHHLPVTTQQVLVGGVEFWGYPKILAEISFEDTEKARSCLLRADGKDILTLVVDKVEPKTRRIEFFKYNVKAGQLLRTRVLAQGQYGIARFSCSATHTLGDHPIADELRALGMGATAVEHSYSPQVQSILYPAEESLPL